MTHVPAALVAISGPIGSGKTTMTAQLSLELLWPHAAYGDLVRAVATSRGLAHDRRNLQRIGAELIASGWETFTRQVLAQAGWTPGSPAIVDGVRHEGAVTALRNITAPLPAIVIYLDIPAGDGIARARERDRLPAHPSRTDELRPIEKDLPAVRALADLVLPAASTPTRALAQHVISYLCTGQERQHGERSA